MWSSTTNSQFVFSQKNKNARMHAFSLNTHGKFCNNDLAAGLTPDRPRRRDHWLGLKKIKSAKPPIPTKQKNILRLSSIIAIATKRDIVTSSWCRAGDKSQDASPAMAKAWCLYTKIEKKGDAHLDRHSKSLKSHIEPHACTRVKGKARQGGK
jgi:hypothetical protein